MKGIVFSSDFVIDSNGNERLLEINTDTSFLDAALSLIDYTDFFNVLQSNNITKLNVVYKDEIHRNFVDHISSSVAISASFITQFDKTIVAESNIFPPVPVEDSSTFILRLAYDESAIVDSEYAKGTLNLLKLFADNDDTGSVCGFYHSSSLEGFYNTIDDTINDSIPVPDFVVKTIFERRKQSDFYKIGKSNLSASVRLNEFIDSVSTDDFVIQQYHFNTGSVNNNNKITSLRSFKIVYGANLDLISLADYEIEAMFDLPTSLSSEVSEDKINNLLSGKHYYEFATNFTKKPEKVLGGLLDSHEILMADDSQKQLKDVVIGDLVRSYHISGSPLRDNREELFAWSQSGHYIFSTGSYMTSSYIENIFSASIVNNMVGELKIGADVIYSAPANVFLVYESNNDRMIYKRALQIEPSTDYLINNDGATQSISENNMYLLNNDSHSIIEIDVEEVDTYLIAGTENLLNTTFVLTHNWYCFVPGTKITMGDGTQKNIEDIVIGDEVLSFNGITNEPKKVIETNSPIHNDLIKYTFDNNTEIICTQDHPFFVVGGNAELASFAPDLTNDRYDIEKNVRQIEIGDLVFVNDNNSHTKIKNIETLNLGNTKTYIFRVEDNHNFYANNILVHNK